MTFPLKEQLVYFEKLHGLQSQIYADACDVGIPPFEINEEEYRANITALMAVYGYKATNWSTGKSVAIFIPIEYEAMDTYRGVTLEVGKHDDPTLTGNGFISIGLYNGHRNKADIPLINQK